MKKTALFTALLCLTQSSLHADVPLLINYQGKVADSTGLPIGANGTAAAYTAAPTNRKMIVRIYSAATGGTPLWAEEQTATISSGVFSVLLGNGIVASGLASGGGGATLASEQASHTDLSAVFSGSASRFLEIVVDSGDNVINLTDVPISPRQQITSTAFAFHAKVADSIASAADLTINPPPTMASAGTAPGAPSTASPSMVPCSMATLAAHSAPMPAAPKPSPCYGMPPARSAWAPRRPLPRRAN